MHSLLKHKMLQLTLKISLYMAATCLGPFGPSLPISSTKHNRFLIREAHIAAAQQLF
jgi:hypothetical protein